MNFSRDLVIELSKIIWEETGKDGIYVEKQGKNYICKLPIKCNDIIRQRLNELGKNENGELEIHDEYVYLKYS